MPASGAETFEILGEAEILPLVLSEALARMVGFKNIRPRRARLEHVTRDEQTS